MGCGWDQLGGKSLGPWSKASWSRSGVTTGGSHLLQALFTPLHLTSWVMRWAAMTPSTRPMLCSCPPCCRPHPSPVFPEESRMLAHFTVSLVPRTFQGHFVHSPGDGLEASPSIRSLCGKARDLERPPCPLCCTTACVSFALRALLATRRCDGGPVSVCRVLSTLHRLGACVWHRARCALGPHYLNVRLCLEAIGGL